jgi:hypothetical protein
LDARFEELLPHAKARSLETLNVVLDKIKTELVVAKAFNAERGEQFRRHLARDSEQIIEVAWELRNTARQDLHPEKYLTGARASLVMALERSGKHYTNRDKKRGRPLPAEQVQSPRPEP